MKVGVLSASREFVRRHVLILLLIAAHGPLIIEYLTTLWQKTHYQFFPFAIGAFIWLLVTRRSQEPQRWTRLGKALIAADICCLAYGYYNASPWFAALGLVAVATAWALSYRDAGYSRSLGYLGLLLLLVIRLPLLYDEAVIQWLQRITTSISSKTLNRLELLHVREGNLIEFPGKQFLVEEACSGVQSLFTILFLAALVICLKRRSVIHGIALLASGILFAGIMNVTRVVTIAAAWEISAIDLSVGWLHDVLGYLCLAVAALLLMSTDAFLGFLSDPIPDIKRPGPVGMFRNPLIMAWNKVLTVMPSGTVRSTVRADVTRADAESAKTPGKAAGRSSGGDDGSLDTERRVFPPRPDLLSPANWFHFTFGVIENWIFSRRYGQLTAGLPFLATAVGGVLLIWWLRHASEAPVLAAYEAAFNVATETGDAVRQETYLRALSGLRSDDPQYQFRLGQFLVSQGRIKEGLRKITALASESNLGSTAARKWLVAQAMSENPLMKMTAEEIEQQLQKILSHVPHDAEVHELLAQQYIERKEWKLAEQHLADAARAKPELNLELARLKSRLNRSPDDIMSYAQQAVEALAKRLEQNRSDASVRIALSEALSVAARTTEARETLVSGLNQHDDPQLRAAVCNFDLILVERQLRESILNRDAGMVVVLNALSIDPSNVSGVQMLTALHSLGAEIPVKSVQASLNHWQTILDQNPDDAQAGILLSQLLLITGDFAKSAETIRPLLAARPELRFTFARLLLKSGQKEEGIALLETLISESQATLATTPGDLPAATTQAGALLALERPEAAREFLMSLATDPASDAIPSNPGLAQLFGQASVDIYDKLTGNHDRTVRPHVATPAPVDTGADTATLLTLLSDAFRCQRTTHWAIDRLAKLSLSSHPAAAAAEAMIRQLRMEGAQGVQALNMLGMHALVEQRYDIAQKHLEQANALAQGNNEMVLNNLATAIVRGGGDLERALEFANSALARLKDHPDVLSTRGEIYVAMQRWKEALADLQAALNSGRKSAEVHRLLEKTYTGLADPQMAKEHRLRADELESAQAAK